VPRSRPVCYERTFVATTELTTYPGRDFAAWNQRDLTTALTAIADLAFHPVGEPLVDVTSCRVSQEWRMVGTHSGEGRAASVHAYWNVGMLLAQLGLG
jgi:hypothetical protein